MRAAAIADAATGLTAFAHLTAFLPADLFPSISPVLSLRQYLKLKSLLNIRSRCRRILPTGAKKKAAAGGEPAAEKGGRVLMVIRFCSKEEVFGRLRYAPLGGGGHNGKVTL